MRDLPLEFTESIIHNLNGYDYGLGRYINARESAGTRFWTPSENGHVNQGLGR